MKYFAILSALFIPYTSLAQKEIKIEDAINHVGDSVKICSMAYGGTHLETAKGLPTFLNLGRAYPDPLLTIVITDEVRKQFKIVPEDFFNNLEVCVTGK